MQLATSEKRYILKCVENAGWEAVKRFEYLMDDANDAAKDAGTEAAREAEIEGLGPDEVGAAYDEAGNRGWEEVWIRGAFGDDPPPGLIFCQPSEGAYVEAAEEEAEKQALATLAAPGTIVASREIEEALGESDAAL
jgi:hypothetical protein